MKSLLEKFKVRRGSDQTINIIVIGLAIFGLIMAISASMTDANNSTRLLVFVTIKQLAFLLISYGLMVVSSKLFSYKLAKPLIMPFSLLMIGLLLATLFFKETNGAKAWLRFGAGALQFTIQPSEFAKVSGIILLATFLGEIPLNTRRTRKEIVRPIISVIAIQAAIILILQKDMGSALVLLLITYFLLLIPSHPRLRGMQNIMILLFAVGLIGAVFILSDRGLSILEATGIFDGYKLDRFKSYANPFALITGAGYQLSGSLIAFSRGGWFGTGLGHSVQKYGYLPEASTDFIVPLIGEELGFVGLIFLMFFYAVLLYRLTYYALKVKDDRDKMILIGTVLYLFIHVLLNVGGASGSIPLTGVPLLLISSGGSSMMSVMIAIGICQSIISKYRLRIKNENS